MPDVSILYSDHIPTQVRKEAGDKVDLEGAVDAVLPLLRKVGLEWRLPAATGEIAVYRALLPLWADETVAEAHALYERVVSLRKKAGDSEDYKRYEALWQISHQLQCFVVTAAPSGPACVLAQVQLLATYDGADPVVGDVYQRYFTGRIRDSVSYLVDAAATLKSWQGETFGPDRSDEDETHWVRRAAKFSRREGWWWPRGTRPRTSPGTDLSGRHAAA